MLCGPNNEIISVLKHSDVSTKSSPCIQCGPCDVGNALCLSEPDLGNIVIVVMSVGGGGNQDMIYFTDTDTDDGDIVLSR